jgi:hypothetical protein
VAAQPEEVVVEADLLDAQHLPPRGEHDALLGGLGLGCEPARVPPIRFGQPRAVLLAAHRARQRVDPGDEHRDHRRGQPVPQILRQAAEQVVPGGNNPGHEPPRTVGIGDRPDRGLDHLGVGLQRRLDLARLDPDAVDLHLGVGPADEFERAVRARADEVTGAIHPRSGRALRVRHEALCGPRRVPVIAAGHARPADPQLPHRLVGAGFLRREQQAPHVVDRRPDRHRAGALAPVEARGQHVDRALGGAVGVHDLHVDPVEDLLAQLRPELLAGGADQPQAPAGGQPRLGREQPQHAGHDLQHGGPPLADRGDQRGRVPAGVGVAERHRRAADQRREDLPAGRVERQRGLLQHPVGRGQPQLPHAPPHPVGDARVLDDHALRRTGGT